MVHAIEHARHNATEGWRSQTDAAQLGQSQLATTDIARHLQRIALRIVVHQSDITHPQRIVDVRDIVLNIRIDLTQPVSALLLMMVRLDHLRHISPCHIESLQPPLGIANRIDGRLVIYLALQSERFSIVARVLKVLEVDDRGGTGVLGIFQLELAEEGIVLEEELPVEHKLAVGNMERAKGLVVDVAQHAVAVVEQHVDKRRIENRVIAQQQLVHFLLLQHVGCDIVLDTKQLPDPAFLVGAHYRELHLIEVLLFLVLRITPQLDKRRGTAPLTDVEHLLAHTLEVVALKKVGKVNGIVFVLVIAILRQREIVTARHIIEPQFEVACLQNQRQSIVHTLAPRLGILFLEDIQPVIKQQDKDANQKCCHNIHHDMVRIERLFHNIYLG